MLNNTAVILATVSTLMVVIIAVLGYYYGNNQVQELQHKLSNKMQNMVGQLNQTGINRYELDLEQSEALHNEAKHISKLLEDQNNSYMSMSNILANYQATQEGLGGYVSHNILTFDESELSHFESLQKSMNHINSTISTLQSNAGALQTDIQMSPIYPDVERISVLRIGVKSVEDNIMHLQNNMQQFNHMINRTVQGLAPNSILPYFASSNYVHDQIQAFNNYQNDTFATVGGVNLSNSQIHSELSDIQRQFMNLPGTYANQVYFDSAISFLNSNLTAKAYNIQHELNTSTQYLTSNYATINLTNQLFNNVEIMGSNNLLQIQNLGNSNMANETSNVTNLQLKTAMFGQQYLSQDEAKFLYATKKSINPAISNFATSLTPLYAPLPNMNLLQNQAMALPFTGGSVTIPSGGVMSIGNQSINQNDIVKFKAMATLGYNGIA